MIRIRKSDGTRLKIRKNGASYIARLFNSMYKAIVSLFKSRVMTDGGTFEAESYIENKLGMFTQTIFNNASYVISPNGYKTSKIYALKPEDGSGDLAIVRNTTATRINEYGVREVVPANKVRIDYSNNGKPCFLIEPQRTNLVYPSATATTQVRAVTAVAHTLSFYGTGTVTLSGAFSGSLVGTGVNNRVSLTFTPTAGNLTLTVSGTVTDWQLEAGSNATSYIPTVTGSVTRNNDYPYKSNIINLIGQTEGSIYVEFDRTTETSGFKHLLTIYGNGLITNSLFLTTTNNQNISIACAIRVNSVVYQFTSFAVKEGLNKVMVTYTNSEVTLFLNGFKIKSMAIPSFPSMYNIIPFNYEGTRAYGMVYFTALWKTKLSDANAVKLTAL